MDTGIVVYHVSWTRLKDGTPKLKLFVTDQDGYKARPIFLDFPIPAYFYATKDIVDTKGLPEGMKADLVETANRGKVYKISVREPSEVSGLKDYYGANTFEADVPFSRRVMIDRDMTVTAPKRRLYIDIETDPRGGVPDEKLAERRILSVAAWDNEGRDFFFCDTDETAMMGQFLVLQIGRAHV